MADICIGSSSSPSARRSLLPALRQSLEDLSMPSCLDRMLPTSTSVNTIPGSKDLGNGVPNPLRETLKQTGSLYGPPPSPEISYPSLLRSVWLVTGPFERLRKSLINFSSDYSQAPPIVREIFVFWGKTGTGKSRRAWHEAGVAAYSKDPRSKFWDGYQDQRHVVIDEFRGGIDVSHLLR